MRLGWERTACLSSSLLHSHQGTTLLITGAMGSTWSCLKKRVHPTGLGFRGLKLLEKLWKETIFCSTWTHYRLDSWCSWEHEQTKGMCVCMCVRLVLVWGAPESWGRRSTWLAKGRAEETPQSCGDIKQICSHLSIRTELLNFHIYGPMCYRLSLPQPLPQVPSYEAWNHSLALSHCPAVVCDAALQCLTHKIYNLTVIFHFLSWNNEGFCSRAVSLMDFSGNFKVLCTSSCF